VVNQACGINDAVFAVKDVDNFYYCLHCLFGVLQAAEEIGCQLVPNSMWASLQGHSAHVIYI